MSRTESKGGYLDLARQLVKQIEEGDGDGADHTIEKLTCIRETALFQELGALTRALHEALKSFKVDTRLSDIAANDIPDARERLNHVIAMTEQSAHRTLTAIETSLPLIDEIGDQARYLNGQWQRFRNRELSADEFRRLSQEVNVFLQLSHSHGSILQRSLSEALLAQDYQDLTGQIIRHVIKLVQEVENGLVALVRIPGAYMSEAPPAAIVRSEKDVRRGQGPALPGRDEDVVCGQDEVDDLLSSLGF